MPHSSTVSSSLASRPPNDAATNPVRMLVNEYYAKQQAAYMQRRRQQQQQRQASLPVNDLVEPQQSHQDTAHLSTASKTVSQFGDPYDHLHTSADTFVSNTSSVVTSEPPADRLLKWSARREQALALIRHEESQKLSSLSSFQTRLSAAAADDDAARPTLVVPPELNGDSNWMDESLDASSISKNLFVDASTAHHDQPQFDSPQSRQLTTQKKDAADVSETSPQLPVVERLLALGSLAETHKEHLRWQRERELAKQHPFHPATFPRATAQHNGSATADYSKVSSTVTSSTEAWDRKRGVIEEREIPLDSECTFHPAITEKAASMRRTSSATSRSAKPGTEPLADASENVFTRLYSSKSTTSDNTNGSQMQYTVVSLASVLPPPLVEEIESLRETLSAPAIHEGRTHFFNIFLSNVAGDQKVSTPYVSQASQLYQPPRPNSTKPGVLTSTSSDSFQDLQDEAYKQAQLNISPHQFIFGKKSDGVASNHLSQSDEQEEYLRAQDEQDNELSSSNNHQPSKVIPFNSFLLRQESSYQKKQRNLLRIQQQSAPPLRPNICDHSKILAANAKLRRETGNIPSPIRTADKSSRISRSAEINFTFKPVLTKAGVNCPSRGVGDMHLDFQRRREKLEQSIRQKESEEMHGVTFQPLTNKERNAHVQSALNPKNLHILQESQQRRQQEMEERRLEQERKAQIETIDQCTFRPKVTRLPSFVSHMTSAVALVREAAVE